MILNKLRTPLRLIVLLHAQRKNTQLALPISEHKYRHDILHYINVHIRN